MGHEVVEWITAYLGDVRELPVLPRTVPGAVRAALPADPPERGESLDSTLSDFRDLIVPALTHWNHPGFYGYFPSSASVAGILGEMLTAAVNVNAMVWRSSPAATELEGVATDWLRKLLDIDDGFEGVINDTASSSSLYALAAARESAYPQAHRAGLFGLPPGRVYASEEAHSSIEKAVLALGLGQDGYRRVPADERYALRPDALAAALAEDRAAGVRPVAVVATVGTTSSTAVDPVRRLAELARAHGAWLHVDAAYAGSAAILPELRAHFDGWEGADSIVVNPHKWLFTPIDCSVLYCRRPDVLARAFSIVPEYLRSEEQGRTRDLMDYGISLGRRLRALKLWMVLRCFGREGLAARIRAHVALAAELAARVGAEPAWRVVAPVPFATLVLRHEPEGLSGEALDAHNRRILERVNESGEAFLTHTALSGRYTIRVAIGNLRTTRDDVDRLWALMRAAAARG